jgi:tetratricopeptide (TPR) repeat protein
MNWIIKQFSLLVLFLSISVELMAFNPQGYIQQGNTFYSNNQFEKALKEYQTVLDSGFVSAELYFNMGNSYFKLANYKKAILYYEKSKLLSPGDTDIEFNLEMARSFTVDKIEAIPELFFVTWFKEIRNSFSSTLWGVISLATFIISLVAWLIYLLSGSVLLKKIGFWFGAVLILLSITAFSFGSSLKHLQTGQQSAIIFTPSVSIKSTPSESGTNLFVLHEGTKVDILETIGTWCQVKIASGDRGWIKWSDLEKI